MLYGKNNQLDSHDHDYSNLLFDQEMCFKNEKCKYTAISRLILVYNSHAFP